MAEEFDAPIDLNADPYWTWGDGTIDSGQARFVEDAITFADGKMKITVSKGDTPSGLSIVKSGIAPGAQVPARTLKSGELRSKHNMFRYGRYEASIKGPPVDGNYILSFFSFRTPHFQEWREIDFELLGSLPNGVSTNVIIGMNMQGWVPSAEEPASTFPFGGAPAMGLPAAFAARGVFHTYAFEALPDHVDFFVDGALIRRKVNKVGKNALIVPERSWKMMFNHWVFENSGFGGDPTKNTYPFTGEYDWFRFYKWNNDTDYPCEPLPACLPAADKDLSANNPKEK
jgi:beta-glucanase (GH16 family)